MKPVRRDAAPWRAILAAAAVPAVAGGLLLGAHAINASPAGSGIASAVAVVPAAAAPGPDAHAVADVAELTDVTDMAASAQSPVPQAGRPATGLGCEGCHGELELLRQQAGSLARAQQLLVPAHVVAASAHGGMGCADCHSGYVRYPHDERSTSTQSCASCHGDADALWQRGSHAQPDSPVSCAQCHTTHDVRSAETLRSAEGAAHASAPCLGCHETERLERHNPHAAGVSCAACHAPHDVRPVVDPESWLAPARQFQTCGACHDSVAATWRRDDIHGNEELRGNRLSDHTPAATTVLCTSCHFGHDMVATDDERFASLSVERCAACHEHHTRTFFGSYHGKATALGSRVAASCADCHGAHDILPQTMAASRVAPDNLVETCRACHAYARPAFVLYDAHPDPFNRARNPWIYFSFWMMNGLLIFVLAVFGTHTILWWIRLWLDKRRGIIHGPGHGGH
jgi:hypothetical protein